MTVESTDDESTVRDTLVRNIKRFSLSYEQHQLIASSNFALLVSHIISKRRPFTIIIAILALFCGIQTIQGLLASSTLLPWLFCAAATATWAFSRFRKVRSLSSAYSDYLSIAGESDSKPNTLASELMLSFNLNYPEHQAVRSGDAREAAQLIIARRKTNSMILAIGGAAISLVATATWGILGFYLAVTLTIGVVVSLLIDRSAIAKVVRLLERYPEEIAE